MMPKKKELTALQKLIKDANLKQIDVARKMNYSPATIHGWCCDYKEPDCYDIIRLSKILNVSIEKLVLLFGGVT